MLGLQLADEPLESRKGGAVEPLVHIAADVGGAAERPQVRREGAAGGAQVLAGEGDVALRRWVAERRDDAAGDIGRFIASGAARRFHGGAPAGSLGEQDVGRQDAGRLSAARRRALRAVFAREGIEGAPQLALSAPICSQRIVQRRSQHSTRYAGIQVFGSSAPDASERLLLNA